jgi:dipeptidase D
MQVISSLKPEEVWHYFEEILAIPRISKKETRIIEYLEQFAREKNLDYKVDPVGNVLITKPANPGMGDRKTVILQSHLDMVGEKNEHTAHDFSKDPIQPVIEGDWLRAEGTTLGADDGIGVAVSMAILASDSIAHGPLECLFTVDEESGMTGALGLQSGFMKGNILLNLDSEDEGEIFIGCAGGIDTIAQLKLKQKRITRKNIALRVRVNGLSGGHSGDEIHRGLGNSIKILNRFLWNADQRFRIRLVNIEGGHARNAIPREASAVITVPSPALDLVKVYFESFTGIIKKEMETVEPGLTMSMEHLEELPPQVIRRKQQRKLFDTLYACPHGVVSMSQEIPGLVETSTNLASVKRLREDLLEIMTSQRSSVESSKRDIADRMSSLFRLLGARVRHSDGYPAWKPNVKSEILAVSKEVYSRLFGKEPVVRAIHAGLECGLFLQKYPELDMISVGPTIRGAHTPEERIEIPTVDMFWKFLLEILRNTPKA